MKIVIFYTLMILAVISMGTAFAQESLIDFCCQKLFQAIHRNDENDENAALKLWTEKGVRVLPGTYLGQVANEQNPGSCYVRVALVAPIEEAQRGLSIIRDCLYK